jgi:HAD superfamily hydrolase (TIGR01490 family)
MTNRPKIAAFFDVDETLITTKSMFDFLVFFASHHNGVDASGIIQRTRHLSASGADRSAVNLTFWTSFTGVSKRELRNSAELWTCKRLQDRESFIIGSSYRRLQTHRRLGHYVALVSGSSVDILEPLARELEVDALLATRQIVADGIYTGQIEHPIMIGAGKRQAIEKLAAIRQLDLRQSYAYGDHISDLPMLEVVGSPIIVGDNKELRGMGALRGWESLPGMSDSGIQEGAV